MLTSKWVSTRTRPRSRSYVVELGVCFLVLCEKTYPKLLAFSFLLELQSAFFEAYTNSDIQAAMRPYEFIKFGTAHGAPSDEAGDAGLTSRSPAAWLGARAEPTLQRIRRRYLSPRTLKTPHDLTDLSEKVQSIRALTMQEAIGAEYRPFSARSTRRRCQAPRVHAG